MKRKLVCCLLCAAMLLGLLTGCGSKTEPPAPTAAPTDNGGQTGTESGETVPAPQGKTDLRVAVNMDAPGFDPYTSGYNVSSALICRNVYETLLNLDAAGNLYAGLATDWEWGADNMSVILTIRQGVKFSNGEDLNADVVIFSLRDYRGKTAVGGEGESLFDFDNMKKLDDFKVEIPLKRAGSDAFITLTDQMYSICSKKAAEELGDNYPNNPVGTGPYKFVSFTSGVGAKLEANEDYWGGAPAIKTVETVLIAESSQAQIELENGNIDWVTGPDNMDIARIQSGSVSGLKTMEMPAALVKNIWFNFRSEPMRDVNVRKAINCAIDKEAIIAVAYGGSATVANQKIANNNGAYDPAYDENPMYPYDIELAKEYLSKSAYPEGLKLTIYSDTTPAEVHILECVKNDLAKIGIEVKIFNLDSNVAVPTLIAGEEDDMYAAIGCTSVGYAPGYLKNCSPDMVPNWGAWPLVECDEAINDLYVKSLATTDVDECNKLVKEAIRLELENAMSVPVCYPISYMTCSEKLQGVTINGGNCTFLLADAYFEG